MKFKGKIDNINHIVISDPIYEKKVWCRYEKNGITGKDWIANLNIYPTETKIDRYIIKGVEFFLLLQKNNKVCNLDENGTLKYLKNIELKNYEIGMDSACIALGINDKAKEIIASQEEWQPLCAIRTGTDGIFGEVYEGIDNEKLCFLLIKGYFDEEYINQNDLFDYLIKQFQIKDLIKEDFTIDKNNHVLKKGDKVEVSSCVIINPFGGTVTVRNSNFKDEIDGMKLNVEKTDGTIEHTIIESHDKLVNFPIDIEIIEDFYDYETGYNYKGKIINNNLLEELKKTGVLDFKSEDCQKHNNKLLYEDNLKANENYNSPIAHFSEFDIVKILEKNQNYEMEI